MFSLLSFLTLSEVLYHYENQILTISGTGKTSKSEIQKAVPNSDYQELIIREGVDTIDEESFSFAMSLSKANIEHVRIIGERAFASCSRLEEIAFGEGLEEIRDNAFERAVALTSISLPSTLTSIGIMAFAGCHLISEVSIPQSTYSIGAGAFAKCRALKQFKVASKHQRYHDGVDGALYNVERSTLISYPAGANKDVISFESTCTTIGPFAMSSSENIVSVNLPSHIKRIDDQAFQSCTKLESIYLEVKIIPSKCFMYCPKLKTVTLKEGVEVIEGFAFDGCIALNEISFPNSLVEIGEHAFERIPISEAIGKNVKKLGDYAFASSATLTTVSFPNIEIICDHVFDDSDEISKMEIGDKLKQIGAFAFAKLPKLTSITLPDTLDTIGVSAFLTSGLESIVVPPKVSVIPSYCFRFSMLKNITIMGIIKQVEGSAFKTCSHLETLTFINNVESIANDAFSELPTTAVLKYCGRIAVNGTAAKDIFGEVLVGSYYPKNIEFAGVQTKVTDTCVLPPVPTTPTTPNRNETGLYLWIGVGVSACAIIFLGAIAAALWCKRYKARKEAITESLISNKC